MKRPGSAEHQFTRSTSWDPARKAEPVSDHILMSRGNSNSYLVTTGDEDVVINTGTLLQGTRHRERYEEFLGRRLNIRKVIFTQSHPDHMGGWAAFNGPGVETIAQENYPEGRLDRTRLKEFFFPRHQSILGRKIGFEVQRKRFFETPEAVVSKFFRDEYLFELGGRRFELYALPGAETLDSLMVWLPEEKTVFTGNFAGALWGALPHLFTPRGDRSRSARTFIRSVERLLALQPEMVISGHDEPIRGWDRIRADFTRVRDATRYIHDETVKGMNAGKDLWTLMRDIQLPAHLKCAPGRGPVHWYVRAVWEEYAAWFRFESVTELYEVPQKAIWGELADLAGVEALAERARAHITAGRTLEALHLTDIALSSSPKHRPSIEIRIAALEQLIERNGGETFDDLAYLETELASARATIQ